MRFITAHQPGSADWMARGLLIILEFTMNLSAPSPLASLRGEGLRTRASGFTLLEVVMSLAVVVIGFLGLFASALQAGKLASAAEEDALVMCGLEQRTDELRLLDWPELTDGTGITTKVLTARPAAMAGIRVTQETLTLSPCDVSGTRTLTATWNGTSSPTISFSSGTVLSGASAVKAVATLTWTGRRSNRTQTRSLVTVISRGGISKSEG